MKSARAAMLDDLLRRLALRVEFPVTLGILVRRVQNRMVEKWVIHSCFVSSARYPAQSLN